MRMKTATYVICDHDLRHASRMSLHGAMQTHVGPCLLMCSRVTEFSHSYSLLITLMMRLGGAIDDTLAV